MRAIAPVILLIAASLCGCAGVAPQPPSRSWIHTQVVRPDGGTLSVASQEGVALDGANRRLIDQSWVQFCEMQAELRCDPAQPYHVQIGVEPGEDCWSTVYGVLLPRDGFPQRTALGVLANFRCPPWGLPAGGRLLAEAAHGYRPGDDPPIGATWTDEGGPSQPIQDSSVPIQALDRRTLGHKK